jgi:hypothetical protein
VPALEPCIELLVPELVEFIHGGVAMFVGSASAALEPALARGFAPRVAPDRRRIDVFVGRIQSTGALANLTPGRPMAVTLGSPVDYRGIQIKGVSAGWRDPDAADADWVDEYARRFDANCQQVGLTATQAARLRCHDLIRITLVPVEIFRQTPGPGAGGALAGGL